jgi:hypothetical protein
VRPGSVSVASGGCRRRPETSPSGRSLFDRFRAHSILGEGEGSKGRRGKSPPGGEEFPERWGVVLRRCDGAHPRRGEQGPRGVAFASVGRFPPGAQGKRCSAAGCRFSPGKRRGSFEEGRRRSHGGGSPFPVFLHDFPRRRFFPALWQTRIFLGGPHGAAVFRCGVRPVPFVRRLSGACPLRNCSSSQSKSNRRGKGADCRAGSGALAPLSRSKTWSVALAPRRRKPGTAPGEFPLSGADHCRGRAWKAWRAAPAKCGNPSAGAHGLDRGLPEAQTHG